MKRLLGIALLFATFSAFAAPKAQVFFGPDGGCTEAITNELAKAKKSILVQAYSFTSVPIAKAIVDAKKRGVNVTVILDSSQRTDNYSSADYLHHSGVPTLIDSAHAIAHNKVIVIDGETVITGSMNFTKAGEQSNAENVLVLRYVGLARQYTTNWQAHAKHSAVYAGKAVTKQ